MYWPVFERVSYVLISTNVINLCSLNAEKTLIRKGIFADSGHNNS